MKYFVTGAAGFIGSNYVRWLLANTDHTVTVFDKLTYAGNLESINDLVDAPDGRCAFVQGDICDRDAVEAALPGHDIVVHFAAESHVDRSIEDPYAFVHTNVFGTNVLCDVARRSDIERFVHISTDETYGSIDVGSFQESDRLVPRSPYSAAKAGSDLIALSYVTTYGLPVVVTRCSNNYGPYQFPEKLIPLFTTNLLDGHKVPLYGDGGNIRDWIHVEDHNRAVQVVLEKGEIGDQIKLRDRMPWRQCGTRRPANSSPRTRKRISLIASKAQSRASKKPPFGAGFSLTSHESMGGT